MNEGDMSDPKEATRRKLVETAHVIHDGANGVKGGIYIPLTYNGGAPNFSDQERSILGQMLVKAQGVQQIPSYRLPNGTETTGVFVPEDQNPGFREHTIRARDQHNQARRAAHEAEMAKLKEQDPQTHKDRASVQARAQLGLIGIPEIKVIPGSDGANIPVDHMDTQKQEQLKRYLKENNFAVGEGFSQQSGHVLKLYGTEPNDPRVSILLENHEKANPSFFRAGHKSGPSGLRGHAHIGAMGLAATVLVGASAFQQAKAAGVDLKDQFKAAATAILPTGAAIAQGRKAEAVAATVDRLDPTGGFISNGVRSVMQSVGLNVEEGALSAAPKNKNPQQVIRDKQLNDRIDREQTALFDPNHPDQLGALKVTDPKTGQKLDTASTLKDPAQRHLVFDEIKRLEKLANTPEAREAVGHMRDGAQKFVDLEKRRRPELDSTNYAMGTGPGVVKQIPVTPTMGGPG